MRFKFLIALIILSCKLTSQNNLNLFSSDGKVIRVYMDEKLYKDTWQAHVLLEEIMQDTLTIEVEYENKKRYPATFYFLEQGLPAKNREFEYRLECDDVKLNARFLRVYQIYNLPNPIVPVKPIIDTSKKYQNAVLGRFCELKEGKPFYFNNVPQAGVCERAMPNTYLEYVAVLMKRAEVPDHRFRIVENVCRNNCLSIQQLILLLNSIDFEVEKMKIVRLAYHHVVDPINKMQLEKSFRFDASIKELNTFFNGKNDKHLQPPAKCESPASQLVVDRYCEKLADFANDTERLSALKKGYMEVCYSSMQVSQILKTFVHDREKLESAKLLFPYCVDTNKFFLTKEVFSANQSANELQNFIDNQTR